jgi:hypothetical protein
LPEVLSFIFLAWDPWGPFSPGKFFMADSKDQPTKGKRVIKDIHDFMSKRLMSENVNGLFIKQQLGVPVPGWPDFDLMVDSPLRDEFTKELPSPRGRWL